MSEVKMTREELDRIRNDYEFGVIEKTEFEELSDEVEQTFINCLTNMALASDSEVEQKMAFILDKPIKIR